MFGMSFSEIIVVMVVAVIVLGPDKLPQAMVKIAKFFKYFKQTINTAKGTFEQEVRMAELKDDAKKFKDSLEQSASSVRKKLSFEELDELKKTASALKDDINESLSFNANLSSQNAKDALNNANFDDENTQNNTQNSKITSEQNTINNEILSQKPNEISAQKANNV
ncbi:twin arginine translocation system, TatB protein [Candidatus Campylobacter infans]|uniref:Sec-independent protein translocase protein TatB homolog n=1 Tax=Candidatus Campylobacter infans TaxID=2561898 RepID=A0A7H9CJC6_9BACT|nr:twin arginine translocation system, TatB protein [Candidatus Campylobacter infans]